MSSWLSSLGRSRSTSRMWLFALTLSRSRGSPRRRVARRRNLVAIVAAPDGALQPCGRPPAMRGAEAAHQLGIARRKRIGDFAVIEIGLVRMARHHHLDPDIGLDHVAQLQTEL